MSLLTGTGIDDIVIAMNLALVGYRGSGKTSIGRKLADRLWQKFFDVDDLIVQKAGKSIKEIFEQEGEAYFRDLETEVLRELVRTPDQVLGLGGGTVMREENRKLIRGWAGKIVYLRCKPEVLAARIAADPRSAENRPNLTSLGGGLEEIRLKINEREPFYRQVMDVELDVSNLNVEEAVAYIARML
jgi:shikimate kinase